MNTVISQSHGGTYGGQGMYDDDLQHELVKEEIRNKEEDAKIDAVMSPYLYAGLYNRVKDQFRVGLHVDALSHIFKVVAETLETDIDLLKSNSRKHPLPDARHIIVGLILDLYPNYGLKKLGEIFLGGRDHSTIIHSRDTFNNLYGRDKEFTKKVDLVKQNL